MSAAVSKPLTGAAMKTLTLTSSQLEDVRIALVAHKDHLDKFRVNTTHSCTAEFWSGQIRRLDDLLILVSKA